MATEALSARATPSSRKWQIETLLHDFAIVTFAVDLGNARTLIDQERFEMQEFMIGGRTCGLVSAVNFRDDGLHFNAAPFVRASFYQTNFRLYVLNKATREPEVFFIGTTASTPLIFIPRNLWGAPWHRGDYQWSCEWGERRLNRYEASCRSALGDFELSLSDTGAQQELKEGFESLDEQRLVLTHPIMGAFKTPRGTSQYEVWHPVLELTEAKPFKARFDLFERLGLIEKGAEPHSCLVCRKTEFKIEAPPRRL